MRFRTVVIAAALSAGIVSSASAFVRPRGGDATTVFGGVGGRLHRDTRFVTSVPRLAGWQAVWDRDTDVPVQLWGPGIAAPELSGLFLYSSGVRSRAWRAWAGRAAILSMTSGRVSFGPASRPTT